MPIMEWEKGRRGGNIDDRRGRHRPLNDRRLLADARRRTDIVRRARMSIETQITPVYTGMTVGAERPPMRGEAELRTRNAPLSRRGRR